jgi:serine protease AprX
MKKMKRTPVVTWITVAAVLVSMFASLNLSQRAGAQSGKERTARESQELVAADSKYPILSKYATDLSLLALSDKVEPIRGYQMSIDRVIAGLSTSTKAPLVLCESDLDRDAIARGVASRIALGNVPEILRNKRVFRLSLEALARGAQTSADFENRIQAVFAEAEQAAGQVILFVDQMHQYAGARATNVASVTVKTALGRNHFKIFGGATPEAYSNYIATDDSVAKLFDSISIDGASDPGADSTVARDKRKSPINEEFEGDKISSDMRELIESAGPNGRVSAILQVDNVHSAEVSSLLKRYGVNVDSSMAQLGAMKVELPAKAIEALAKSRAANYISPDVKLESFGHVTATTGTDQIRTQSCGLLCTNTYDGSGIGIAVLDSGVDTAHAAFGGTGLLAGARVTFSKDFTTEGNNTTDPYGHGTHVASSAGGVSTASGNSYQGIAYNANIISLRVLNSQGSGTTAALLAAMNWMLSPADPTKAVSSTNPLNKDKYNIRVANLSLGAAAISSYKNDPICRAARALVDAGIVVVAAAGNNGKDSNGNKIYGQIHAPGNEPSVITVGAANTFGTDARNDDGVATYSSRGPTRSYSTDTKGIKHYDNLIKPDLVAPGNKLIFAESDSGGSDGLLGIGAVSAASNLLISEYPQLDSGVTADNNKRLMYLSGTSMATPVVSGSAALLLQANPKLTPNMVKMILMYTAGPIKGFNMLEQGTGEVNVEGAMRLAKLVRTDLSSSTPQDSAMLTIKTAPDPHTTIAGQTFTWSQGIFFRHQYAKGTSLITKYQTYYAQGKVLGDGVVLSNGVVLGDGVVVGDGIVLGDGVVVGDSIFTSAGVVLGDGSVFCSGTVLGDGVVVGDGTVLGDGVVVGDSTIFGDGVVVGDVQAMALQAMIYGDTGPSMPATR